MIVRYGKPIKVKSLLGKANIPFSYTAANVTFYPLTTGTFHSYAGPSVLNIKYVNRQANHKYFLFLNTGIVYSWSYFGIWDTYNTGYEGNRTAPIKDGNNYYALISPTTSATNGVPSFQFGVTQNLPAIANYALIIDLTEIGLDNLTAQEFYNKYNKYFPLIATGEEITIDRKVGQLPISRLPLDYQEVEYIESTGSQYINTDISISSTDASFMSKLKFSVSSFTGGDQVILGNTYQDNCMYWLPQFGGSTLRMFSRGNGRGNIVYGPNLITNTIYNITSYTSQTLQKLVVDDNVYSKTNNLAMMDSQNLYLFANNYKNNTITAYIAIKLYKAQLYKSEQLVRDFIPCYRKSDNVIGLYDLVSGTFSTNIGTGTFLKGPNVTNTISCKVAGGSSDIYYGYNQSADISQTTSSLRGLDYTAEGLGTLSISGTSEQSENKVIGVFNAIQNHTYLALTNFITGTPSTSTYWIKWITVAMGKDIGNGLFFTSNTTSSSAYIMFVVEGANIQVNCKMQFQIIDLTDWFGAGKEPSTVAEFKQKFIKEYYGFCPTPINLTRHQIEALPSYGYNQLIKNGNFVDTSCWSPTYGTITTNDNICTYTITQVGTVGSNQNRINYAQSWQTNISAQHKFLFSSEIYCKYAQNLSFIVHDRSNGYRGVMSSSKKGVANAWNEFSAIMTANYDCLAANADMRIGFSSTADSAVGDKYYAKNFILVDLTDWYGEGKEPTTVEEFKQTFPNKYYAYSKKRLLNKYMINKLEN